MKGLVIRNTGSWYTVQADDGRLYECKVKGNFRLKGIRSTSPVAVGDVVDGRLYECKVKGNFRLKGIRSTSPVAVGDVVSIIPQPMSNGQPPSQSPDAPMVNGQWSMVNSQWSMVNSTHPIFDVFCNAGSSRIFILRPSMEISLSWAKTLRVRMALLVVMLLRFAMSSRLRQAFRVQPSSAVP